MIAEDFTPTLGPSSSTAEMWWGSRRWRYNVGLLVAGLLAFICYVAAVSRCDELNAPPGGWNITIITTLFQGFAYLVMIAVANLCYCLGAWSERFIHPSDSVRYRRIAFRLGFSFSVLLPFTPAVLLFVSCSAHS